MKKVKEYSYLNLMERNSQKKDYSTAKNLKDKCSYGSEAGISIVKKIKKGIFLEKTQYIMRDVKNGFLPILIRALGKIMITKVLPYECLKKQVKSS